MPFFLGNIDRIDGLITSLKAHTPRTKPLEALPRLRNLVETLGRLVLLEVLVRRQVVQSLQLAVACCKHLLSGVLSPGSGLWPPFVRFDTPDIF